MMKEYKYKRPEGELHRVSIRKWNKTFSKRGSWPFIGVEVYLREDSATVQYVTTNIGKLTVLALIPVWYLLGTLQVGLKEAHEDLMDILFQKKRGKFSSDMVYGDRFDFQWEKLMHLVGEANEQ